MKSSLPIGRSQQQAKKMKANEAGTSSAGATTSTTPSSRYFEVFISHRGPDSRSTVVDVIYDAFLRAGVHVFYDDESMREGRIVEGELMEVITNSSIYIPIFSPDYASSTWCLQELAKIIHCWEASQKQEEKKTILPIFYDVDVSTDLKLKPEMYTAALQKHEIELGEDVVRPWAWALRKAATISGRDTRKHGLTELTKLIVEEVCCKLWTRIDPEKIPADYVGMHDLTEDIMKLLCQDTYNVRYVTIHGIGGVGKTTLARLVFKRMSSEFGQQVAFLSDIRERIRSVGIMNLQKDLLKQLFHVNLFDLSGAEQGVNMIKERLKNKKVLIVLDDVDNNEQLSKLVGQPSWFGVGSRIIVTTRNIGIMPEGEGFYGYEMHEMKFDDALKLFSRQVFECDLPPVEYHEISTEVVGMTGGLPLAIKLIAALFKYKFARGGMLVKPEKVVHKDKVHATTSRKPSSRDFEVFLNFRAIDSHSTFVNYLYKGLLSVGLRVSLGIESTGQWEVIEGENMEVITHSKIYIPIFSENYASSKWHLLELEKIMECWEASQEQEDKKMLLPIFYYVDVSNDLKLKTEVYTTALEKHKNELGEDVVKRWEIALQKAAKIKGWDIRDHGEAKLVILIVKEVCRKLKAKMDKK